MLEVYPLQSQYEIFTYFSLYNFFYALNTGSFGYVTLYNKLIVILGVSHSWNSWMGWLIDKSHENRRYLVLHIYYLKKKDKTKKENYFGRPSVPIFIFFWRRLPVSTTKLVQNNHFKIKIYFSFSQLLNIDLSMFVIKMFDSLKVIYGGK